LAQDKLIGVGLVAKPHGVMGELSVVNHADSPLLFAPGRVLWLKLADHRPSPVAILASRPHQGRILLTLEGVLDRNAAEALRGAELLVEASDMPALDEGEVYLHQIEGFAVVLQDGTPVGVLEGLLDAPGQDVWIIRSPKGKEILFPAHEQTLVSIDTKAARIVIDPPPGLLDL
jgi:16S rRNA processing protein RimM